MFSGSTQPAGEHNHSGSVYVGGSTDSAFVGTSSHSHGVSANGSLTTGTSGGHSHGINGSVSVSVDTVAGHSHTVGGALRSRNAGTISVLRHDSSELDGTYYLQIRAAQGGTADLSQRYIHAITMRR